MNIMNYEVFVDNLDSLKFESKQIINTINPHSYITAKSDPLFFNALQNSDILIPDGSGIVFAAQQLSSKHIKKISGFDLHLFLLKKINKEGGKIFYMGSSQDTLNKLELQINKEYSNINVNSYSPPFKDFFSDKENMIIIEKINSFNPDILFIGMTAPKQEKWLEENREKVNFKIASSIGAVFDFYAGSVPRPSSFWIHLHLEWLIRLISDPKRLWRRNFISTPKFLWDIFLFKYKS